MSHPTALILIDVQVNMFDPSHAVHSAEPLLQRICGLVDSARANDTPIIFIRNCGGEEDPDLVGTPGWELHPALHPKPSDPVLDKTTWDAFKSTKLGEELESLGIKRVVIAGLQSEYCIRSTTLGAVSHGFEVVLVEDGHSSYDSDGQAASDISSGINAELAPNVKLVKADQFDFNAG